MKFEEDKYLEQVASNFFIFASETRLKILLSLLKKKSKASLLAKDLKNTPQEIHRNMEKMKDVGLIKKERDGLYGVTTIGRSVSTQIQYMTFFCRFEKFLQNHNFGKLPLGFVQRLGALEKSELVDGISNVLEKWKSVYNNSEEHIFTVLTEIPLDLVEVATKKMNKGIKYCHIISQNANIPEEKEDFLQKIGFYKHVEDKSIERKMKEQVEVCLVLSKKEGMIVLPTNDDNGPDFRFAIYGKSKEFLDWCMDYWRYSWATAKRYDESKLKTN